jgi:endonuclease YncB( thermonuclease family)
MEIEELYPKSELIIEALKSENISTPLFSLDGLTTYGKIVYVYDGDSCDIVLYIDNLGFRRFKCRINGIDCAEKRSANPEEKLHALKALNFVSELLDTIVIIKCYKFDKYGRLLVDIFDNNVSLAEQLIEQKLAYRYNGKTKKLFIEWK